MMIHMTAIYDNDPFTEYDDYDGQDDAWAAQYDDDPSPYDGTYSEE